MIILNCNPRKPFTFQYLFLKIILSIFSQYNLFVVDSKYNPSVNADRSGSSSYPDGYMDSILSRSCAVSRGVGSVEQAEYAKKIGIKGHMNAVYRPKTIDVG